MRKPQHIGKIIIVVFARGRHVDLIVLQVTTDYRYHALVNVKNRN